jgi:hypothetical protein
MMVRMANKTPKIRERDVQGLKYFKKLRPLFERLHKVGCQRDRAHNRTLHMDQYCCLVMLFMFNPIVSSLRAIQQASGLRNVQRDGKGVRNLKRHEDGKGVRTEKVSGTLNDTADPILPSGNGSMGRGQASAWAASPGRLAIWLFRVSRALLSSPAKRIRPRVSSMVFSSSTCSSINHCRWLWVA